MKIYVGTAGVPISCPKKDTLSGVICIYNLGLNLLEIQFVRGVKMSDDAAILIGEKARELGVRLSIHAPYYINLASDRAEVIERSISDWLYNSVRLASLLGAKCVVFHPASYGKKSPEDTYKIVRDNIIRVLELTKKYDVYICPETMGKVGQFGSVDELIRLVREIDDPRLIPCIDFAHIHARHRGKFRSKDDFVEVLNKYFEFISGRTPRLIHIHFSSIEYTEKGERMHLPMSAKEPDFELFVDALSEFNFDEVELVSESPILEEDAIYMRDILVARGLMAPIKVKPIEIAPRKPKKQVKKKPKPKGKTKPKAKAKTKAKTSKKANRKHKR